MAKIELNTPPYFDDYNENKKFYKILFRPGRAVQARELTQLQSILQNQVARLGSHLFKHSSIVYPEGTLGFTYSNNTVYVKLVSSPESLTSTKQQIEEYWLGKDVESSRGVKGTVVGYNMFDSATETNSKAIRLYIDLKSASSSSGVKNFLVGDTVSTKTNVNTTITASISSADYSVGRISKVSVPRSIYFWNDYFVLVDAQTVFLEPPDDVISESSQWTLKPSYDVYIKITESIVDASDDESLYDNANGSPNYGGIGADRLRIDATLVKRPLQTVEQDVILIARIQDGKVVEAPLVDKSKLNIADKVLAKRTYEESGNYTLRPFLIEPLPFLSVKANDRGLYTEDTLSFGFASGTTNEDVLNENQAKEKARDLSKSLFKLKNPVAIRHQGENGLDRYYPGKSYDDVDDATSFVSLCDSMIGLQVDPGVAYVRGFRIEFVAPTYHAVRKARTSDFLPVRKISTPLGNYILVKDVFGSLSIDGEYPYDDIKLHSDILDLTDITPSIPDSSTQIGTARVYSIDVLSGTPGSKNCVYQIGIFDLKLNPGKKFSQVKSIYSSGKTQDSGTFLANLVLKDATKNPALIFTGTVEKIASPYKVEHKDTLTETDVEGRVLFRVTPTDKKEVFISFDVSEAGRLARDKCFDNLSLGSAVKINDDKIYLITAVEKNDSVDQDSVSSETAVLNATSSGKIFSVANTIVDNKNLEVTHKTSSAATGTLVPRIKSIPALTTPPTAPENLVTDSISQINGQNRIFVTAKSAIDSTSTRVKIVITEPVIGAINGTNRQFRLSNSANLGTLKLYLGTTGFAPPFGDETTYPSFDSAEVDANTYVVENNQITFKDNIPGQTLSQILPPTGAGGTPNLLTARYETYVSSVGTNAQNRPTVTLSFAPNYNVDASGRTGVRAKYDYYTYKVSGKQLQFEDAPLSAAGELITVKYDFVNSRSVKLVLNNDLDLIGTGLTGPDAANIPADLKKGIDKIAIVKKIKGKGTLWNSNPGEKVEAGDWVSIGSGDNRRIYKVFSTPTNDNELNLDPDPTIPANAPWVNDSKMTYLIPEDVQDNTSGEGAGLVYQLPHDMIRTIRGGEKNNPVADLRETNYFTKRYKGLSWSVGPSATSVTISGPTSGSGNEYSQEIFSVFSPTLYALIDLATGFWFELFAEGSKDLNDLDLLDDEDPTTFKATVRVDRSGQVSTVTFNIPGHSSYTGTRRLLAITSLDKYGIAARENTKTLEGKEDAPRFKITDGVPGKTISLDKADVFRVYRIIESPSATIAPDDSPTDPNDPYRTSRDGHKIVTSLYEFDDGQTDYYYGISSITRRSGVPAATGRIRIEYSYFKHGSEGNYFSVDSYSNIPYHEIPTYISDRGDSFDLKGCIDFRPRVDDDDDGIPEEDGLLNFKKYNELPKDFVCSYHVYLARKDLFCLTEEGEFLIKEGEPSLTPSYPAEPENGMALAYIDLQPYTATHTQVILNLIDQKRYTMRDISKIETRLKNLENYTSLNLLEKDTKELTIKNALGQDKFKHGFMSNPFHDNSMADLNHPDHQSAPLFNPGELRPKIVVNHIELIESSLLHDTAAATKAHRETYNYERSERIDRKQKYAIYTLDYTHEAWQEQPLCSRVINVNPYAAQTFSGSLKISPWTDTWRETKVADPLKVSDESAFQQAKNSYGDSNEKLVWEATIQEWNGTWDVHAPKLSEPERWNIEAASDHWPSSDGYYRDDKGKTIHAKDIRDGQFVTIPPGVIGEGQRVPFAKRGAALAKRGYTQKRTLKGVEYTTGIKSQFKDLGWTTPVSMGKKIIDVQAAEFIRSKEISFDGRGFFPNTPLFAYFDGTDVTNYCYPESGFGTVREDPTNIIVDLPNAQVSFNQTVETGVGSPSTDPNIPTVTYNPSQSYVAVIEEATLSALSNFDYTYINTASNGLTDAILTGTVAVKASGAAGIVALEGVGTRFKQAGELIVGSVLVFSSNGQEAVVQSIESDTAATLKYPLTSEVPAGSKAADKLEALNTRYVAKYIHIDRSSNASRNIMDKRINLVQYDPKGIVAGEKLRFLLGTGLLIEPTTSFETISLKIKTKPLGEGVGQRTVQLKCDSTGRIKGKFLIPAATVPSNPRFRTGDRIFRLTNSAANEVLPSVSKADAPYSAKGWIDVEQETIYRTRLFKEEPVSFSGDKRTITQTQVFNIWGEVEPIDPIAQTFTVTEETGIFITAVDVFFFSKDPDLDITLQIRPLDDGGNPSNKLLYEKVLASKEVVINKVDLANQTLTVIGATDAKATAGFNKGPWNGSETRANGIYDVRSRECETILSRSIATTPPIINDKNQYGASAAFSYASSSNTFKDAGSHMIPTRFVFDYPVYLKGGNSNYCFVLVTNSVPKGENVEDTYQAYFAQTGPIFSHQDRATPVHRITTVDSDEKEVNLNLGTSEPITTIGTDGVLFKSINGISWESDQTADLKFKIHKAVFKNDRNAQIDFVNEDLLDYRMITDPFLTHKGSGKIRVHHRNHGFVANKSYVTFSGIQGELNGFLVQHLTHPTQGAHLVESCTLDSYVIDLQVSNGTSSSGSVSKNTSLVASNTGNVGGANITCTYNIRFEEMMMITNAHALEKTSLTWHVTPIRGAGIQDLERMDLVYSRANPYPIKSDVELAFDESMQIASALNENRYVPSDGSNNKFSRKSLKVTAILASESPNITPVIDTERLGVTIKTVRLNDPKGLGFVDNINDPTFDPLLFIGPSTSNTRAIADLLPQADAAGKLYFSDTDNQLTGSSFSVNGRRILGVGSLFTIELQVGDTITNSATQQSRHVSEIIDDTTLVLDEEFSNVAGADSLKLSYNPPKLKIKTSNPAVAQALSALKVGQYTTLSGTTKLAGKTVGQRDFTDKLVLNMAYTPYETKIDPELGSPKLCEIEIDHYLPDGSAAGFENSTTMVLTQQDQYIDEIAPEFSSCAAKYVMRDLKLTKPANTLKVIFDGSRTLGSYIDLYYKISSTDDEDAIRSLPWKKLEYSVENSGSLTYVEPEPNESALAFSEYEANALNLKPFLTAKIKIVLRGNNPASYPKVRALRIIALED